MILFIILLLKKLRFYSILEIIYKLYMATETGATSRNLYRIFFMHNLRILKFEAFLRFLEWYSERLRYTFEHGLKNENDFIDSGEELLLNRAMIMMHWKI